MSNDSTQRVTASPSCLSHAYLTSYPRSYLFVPATRTDRITKALASDADAVIIDLEDAVAESEKAKARIDLLDFFHHSFHISFHNGNQPASKPIWIRINNIDANEQHGSEEFQQDIQLCQQLQSYLAGVVLPKVENGETIEHLHQSTQLPIIIQLESATAIHHLQAITKKAEVKGLYAISYGRLDLCNQLNMSLGSQAQQDFINHLRYQILLISTANKLNPPIESIYPDFHDEKGLSETASYVADLGFSGMLAIHPKQIKAIHQAFRASDTALEFAQKVIAHYQATGEAVFDIDEVMVDMPLVRQCQRLLNQQ